MMIRQAETRDIPWLLTQLAAFDQFFGAKRSLFPTSREAAAQMVESMITFHPFFVAELVEEKVRGELVGFIAGTLAPHPYNSAIIVLSETFWWVAPEYRGGSAGGRLLDHFTDFGSRNAQWITMTLEQQSPIDPAALERRGFKPYERSFLMEI